MNSGNGDIYTASETFSGVDFDTLNELNLSGVEFAASGMSSFDKTPHIYTAFMTFSHAHFGTLNELNLSGVKFAVSGMSSGTNETTSATFFGANLMVMHDL